jgi:hypothetical protein
MKKLSQEHLFTLVMFWTVTTTVFAWLPLARIIGRSEGYTWGILGLSGEGTDGPYWVFILLTVYAVTLLFSALRGPRALFYPMLILWHGAVCAVVFVGASAGGSDATIQGQGLHWEIPLWSLGIPCALLTILSVVWVAQDYRSGGAPTAAAWTRANTTRLATSILLMVVALGLFRAGTNYNWVTGAAIVVTVTQWIVLVLSFEPVKRDDISSASVRLAPDSPRR